MTARTSQVLLGLLGGVALGAMVSGVFTRITSHDPFMTMGFPAGTANGLALSFHAAILVNWSIGMGRRQFTRAAGVGFLGGLLVLVAVAGLVGARAPWESCLPIDIGHRAWWIVGLSTVMAWPWMRSLPEQSGRERSSMPLVGVSSLAMGAGLYILSARGEHEWMWMLAKVAFLVVVPMFAFSFAVRQTHGRSTGAWLKRVGYMSVAVLATLVASVR